MAGCCHLTAKRMIKMVDFLTYKDPLNQMHSTLFQGVGSFIDIITTALVKGNGTTHFLKMIIFLYDRFFSFNLIKFT